MYIYRTDDLTRIEAKSMCTGYERFLRKICDIFLLLYSTPE